MAAPRATPDGPPSRVPRAPALAAPPAARAPSPELPAPGYGLPVDLALLPSAQPGIGAASTFRGVLPAFADRLHQADALNARGALSLVRPPPAGAFTSAGGWGHPLLFARYFMANTQRPGSVGRRTPISTVLATLRRALREGASPPPAPAATPPAWADTVIAQDSSYVTWTCDGAFPTRGNLCRNLAAWQLLGAPRWLLHYLEAGYRPHYHARVAPIWCENADDALRETPWVDKALRALAQAGLLLPWDLFEWGIPNLVIPLQVALYTLRVLPFGLGIAVELLQKLLLLPARLIAKDTDVIQYIDDTCGKEPSQGYVHRGIFTRPAGTVRVYARVDNTTLLFASRGGSRSEAVQRVVGDIHLTALSRGLVLAGLQYVPSALHQPADELSRLRDPPGWALTE
eukprot:gene19195-biopygen21223